MMQFFLILYMCFIGVCPDLKACDEQEEAPPSKLTLLELPDEMLLNIMAYFKKKPSLFSNQKPREKLPEDLQSLTLVCKKFNQLVRDPNFSLFYIHRIPSREAFSQIKNFFPHVEVCGKLSNENLDYLCQQQTLRVLKIVNPYPVTNSLTFPEINLPNLTDLIIRGTRGKVGNSLAKGTLTSLLYLELYDSLLDAESAHSFAQGEWQNLLTLIIDGSVLTNEDLILLLKKISNIQHLQLSHCYNFKKGGLQCLATEEFLKLKTLDLSRNHLRPEEANIIATGSFPSLEELNLSYTSIHSKGVIALAAGNLKGLKRFILYGCQIEDAGIKAIAKSLASLEMLGVSDNKLTDEGARYITEGKLSYLQELYITGNYFTFQGIKMLKSLPSLKTFSYKVQYDPSMKVCIFFD